MPLVVRLRARPATSGLIALCTLVFLGTWVAALIRADEPGRALLHSLWSLDDTEVLEAAGALAAVRVWLDGQWWRAVTAGLLHGSWLHLVLNMVGLWVVGQWTERAWGWWRQLVLFFVASVGGCLASLAWAEAPLVVGASAGIFGVAGALVVARAWGRESVKQTVEPVSARVLGFWLGFWLVVGALLPVVFGVSLLAQAGHAGGLVFGVIAGLSLSLGTERKFARLAGWCGVGLGLVGVGLAAGEPTGRVNYHVFVGDALLKRGDFEGAAARFDVALEASPDDGALANAVAYSLAEAGVELERAEELVRRALVGEPDSPHYLDTLGWILCKRGLVVEGLETLGRADAGAFGGIEDIGEHLERCAEVGGE